jgi:hypothetical protein
MCQMTLTLNMATTLISTNNRITMYYQEHALLHARRPSSCVMRGVTACAARDRIGALLPSYGTVGVPMAGNGVPAASEFANVIVSVPSGVNRSTGGLSMV